jgi:hypothetical protein
MARVGSANRPSLHWKPGRWTSGRALAAEVLAAIATVLALYSAWHSIGHERRIIAADRAGDTALTATARRQAPVNSFKMSGDVFDFFAHYLAKGDRVYFQVMPSGYTSELDLPGAVEALGRFYFLPAVQTDNLSDATVVVSYYADPSLLHTKYITQVRACLQTLFVSRIRPP